MRPLVGRGLDDRGRPRRRRRVLRVENSVGTRVGGFADEVGDRGQIDRRNLTRGCRAPGQFGFTRLETRNHSDDTLRCRRNGVRSVLLVAGGNPAAVDDEDGSVIELERHEHLETRVAVERPTAREQLLVDQIAASERNRAPFQVGVEGVEFGQ